MKNSDFIYAGTFNFNTEMPPELAIVYEKIKYKKSISKRISELENEILANKKEEILTKKDILTPLLKSKLAHREITIKYENGEIYPKEIPFPNIVFIQFAEPHVLITDLYDHDREWYKMHKFIKGFSEESYISYQQGCWLSSIASAINCCEYLLKYEYLKLINKYDAIKSEELSKDKHFSLGKFIGKDNEYLKELGILLQFSDKIEYLNHVRVSIYHFNPERAKKASESGTLEVEKSAPISDDIILPITAFRVYNIMVDLINHFYNRKMALNYLKECSNDWMKKRGLTEDDLKNEK